MRVRPSTLDPRAKARSPGRRRARQTPQIVPVPLRAWLAVEIAPVVAALRFGPVLALLLLTLPILVLAYQVPQTHRIGVTGERAGDVAFRWIGREAAIVLPAVGNNAWEIDLRIGSQCPAGFAAPALDVYADNRLVAHVEIPRNFRAIASASSGRPWRPRI